jgi:hypothetical protein
MAEARTALVGLETALRALKNRMKPTDPRKQRVNLLLLAVANKFGADAPQAEIQRVERSTAAVGALFGSGSFGSVIGEAEAAVADL